MRFRNLCLGETENLGRIDEWCVWVWRVNVFQGLHNAWNFTIFRDYMMRSRDGTLANQMSRSLFTFNTWLRPVSFSVEIWALTKHPFVNLGPYSQRPRNFATTQIFSQAIRVQSNNWFAWSQSWEGFVKMAPGPLDFKKKKSTWPRRDSNTHDITYDISSANYTNQIIGKFQYMF
jgi:hypothetical protein